MLVILGYIIAYGSIFSEFAMAGGYLAALFQPLELLMIAGAALGALFVGNDAKSMQTTLKVLPPTSLKASKPSMDLLAMLFATLTKTRRVRENILRSQEDLLAQQMQTLLAEEKIHKLEQALSAMSEKVRIDQLTGLLNRHGLEESLASEFARAQRGNSSLSVMLLDIDNFKQLNDTFGHDVGDKVLQHLAKVVKDTVRTIDVVARYGGEEFIILMPDTSLEHGVDAAKRLQHELTKRFFMLHNERLPVSFSAGVALYQTGENQENVLQRADKAMYLAKELGKNRAVSENDLLQLN